MSPRPAPTKVHLANSPFKRATAPVHHSFSINERVTHDRHGLGTVVRIDGERVVVRFTEQTVSLPRSSSRLHPL